MKLLLFLPLLVSIQDREFTLIQETWIYNNTAKPNNLNEIMSSRLANLVRDLGCVHYSCRENASEILLQQSNADSVRALFWGSHHKDPDIANRCRVTLSLILVCTHCNGSGQCQERTAEYNGCKACFAAWKSRERRERMEDNELSWFLRTMYYEHECTCCLGVGHLWAEDFQ